MKLWNECDERAHIIDSLRNGDFNVNRGAFRLMCQIVANEPPVRKRRIVGSYRQQFNALGFVLLKWRLHSV